MKERNRKPTHFETCMDDNCERKWCVDRRNARCKGIDCTLEKGKTRCPECHREFFCSGYGSCDLHGEHGP